MELTLGRWFVLEVGFGALFLKAPWIGEIWLGPGGPFWDR